MTCIPCSRHRQNVVSAVKAKDVKRIATATTNAAVALGRNTTEKVLAKFGKRK
ncbi:hypothetical protein ACP46_gp15 [Rhizobium phage RHEph06]|uniref:Uncharacterized protein n=2 Tax=Kleczkowskavirus RHEph4 TaxID=1921526 RepID=L7TKU6_9CAUD|nr:hypothetical protein ACP46_gp15 [Rhizobium phage RHEph06]YP_009598456.1 hypothetical protein FDH25_gp14 [Rhizobium phage RHEph04]AGC35776.1 hypothetical protein RHEph05_gp009 [Rhizobium phage RHEph05]QXV74893.1 hypothetical protein [Rhizobium phage RHEph26]AGC35700.1 hypothetical protein RHEph04_gp014 [Rhizobium phage RHEph04]AGC35857.1 hypothetical protein RHEph06_gp015 [Rhizobium phage RHEph06]